MTECSAGCGRSVTPPGPRLCRSCFTRKERIAAAARLLDQDRQVLAWRAEGLTLERIAARLGVSRSWVSRMALDAERRDRFRESEGLEIAQTRVLTVS